MGWGADVMAGDREEEAPPVGGRHICSRTAPPTAEDPGRGPGVLTWRPGPGLASTRVWGLGLSRCRVCSTPSCSNWAMSLRGSQGLWLEVQRMSIGGGSEPRGKRTPSQPEPHQSDRCLHACAGSAWRAGQSSPDMTAPAALALRGSRSPARFSGPGPRGAEGSLLAPATTHFSNR